MLVNKCPALGIIHTCFMSPYFGGKSTSYWQTYLHIYKLFSPTVESESWGGLVARGPPKFRGATTYWMSMAPRTINSATYVIFLIDMQPVFKLWATKAFVLAGLLGQCCLMNFTHCQVQHGSENQGSSALQH